MKSLGSIFAVMMLILTVFYAMQQVGQESVNNSNLDQNSQALILNVSTNLDSNLNVNNAFQEEQSNLTINATFDNTDVFAQEYLEGKSDSSGKQGVVKNLVKIPDLIILSLGVPQQDLLWVKSLVLLILTIILSFAAYRAFFGGGKITDN